jgi:hypothetical protein
VRFLRSFPQNDEPDQNEDVRRQMEQPIPERIYLEIVKTRRRITITRQHVVPLQHLMKNDAVEETAQP